MAHYNISGDLHVGVTIPAGSEVDSVTKSTRVEISEVVDSASLEIIFADPVHMAAVEVTVTGDGPVSLVIVASDPATAATMTIMRSEISEPNPNKRCTFNIRATAAVAFTDPATALTDVGAEPTLADLIITSVAYSAAESVRRSYEKQDLVLVGTNGEPLDRGTFTPKGSFSINVRGDAPVGMAAGTGGAAFKGCATGLVVVSTFTETEKRGDWNGASVEGSHYKSAA